ncbi:hypothetical protein ACHAWF_004679 [Thalassiosira exigua]
MAPIINASASAEAGEDEELHTIDITLSVSKESFHSHHTGDCLVADRVGSLVVRCSEGCDDEALKPHAEGDDESESAPKVRKSQSNLFADEKDFGGDPGQLFRSSGHTPSLGNEGNDKREVVPPLSLMPSFSPSSSLGGLGDANDGFPAFDETKWIQSQIDADEELARQLQEEENERKRVPTGARKTKFRAAASSYNSIFGEPTTWEARSNYSKSSIEEGITSSISMMATSFKKWGSGMTAAAVDFFGEDVTMQTRSHKSKESDSNFRNAV